MSDRAKDFLVRAVIIAVAVAGIAAIPISIYYDNGYYLAITLAAVIFFMAG